MVPRVPLLVFLLWSGMMSAQERSSPAEYHVTDDSMRSLYRVSAFAHGHRHGYEAGYRAADQEIHIGILQHGWKERDVKRAMAYRHEFGDKRFFTRGFTRGFLAGYNDCYADRDFRLPDWGETVPPLPSATDLPQSDAPPQPSRKFREAFDQGLDQGYAAGLKAGAIPADAAETALQARAVCIAGKDAGPVFCDGFVQGFLLGGADRVAVGAVDSKEAALGHVP
jgi:hypothetical protein